MQLLVNADAPMNLIVQTDFFIGNKFISAQLDAVHSKVALERLTRVLRMLTVDLRQRDERTPIVGPTGDGR